MKAYSKQIKRQLRELSGIAYERELESILTDLEKQFVKWRNDEIDCWELVDLIHTFHDKDARELYKMYAICDEPRYCVTYALNNKTLKKEELPNGVMDAIADLVTIE